MNTIARIYYPLKRTLLAAALLAPLGLSAQIGIGTTNPHPSTMLHISPGAGNNKGVLLPKISSGSRVVLDSTQNIVHGLVFFDTDLQKFYYFHQSPRQWREIDTDWIRKDVPGASPVVGTHIYSGVPGNVGIGTPSNINPASKLTVVGNMSVGSAAYTQDSIAPANSMTVQTWLGVGLRSRTSGYEFEVKGDARIHETLRVNGNATAKRYFGEGVVPPGGIIMYSGALVGNFDNNGDGMAGTAYEGWALCDGRNGTPDLRGRFIVGLTNNDVANYSYNNDERNFAEYNTIGNHGGVDSVAITVAQMPTHNHPLSTTSTNGNHTHTYYGYTDVDNYTCSGCHDDRQARSRYRNGSDPGEYAGDAAGSHSHSLNISNQGDGEHHENRPPYYVLAFIMKKP